VGSVDKAILANRTVRAEHDFIHTVTVYVVVQATVIAHLQILGCPQRTMKDIDARHSQL
jgi:hypothetical protein